jgi:hypothetical protein
MKICMDFHPYGAFLSSDVPEMVDQQNSWNSLVIGTYLLYLDWNVGMLAVNICILWPPTSVVVLPEPVMLSNSHRPWAHNVVILPEPARLHSIFFCHFGPTNPNFDMLHCHIALICYIAILLWYATLLLFCYISLMFYIATLLSYASLPLTCHIALICYIAFDILHCFDMLHCHIALRCYITFDMLHCFDMLRCHIARWWKWAKRDECDNTDQHYCTSKISSSNNMK